jgi:organic radical activating enzyme
MTALQVVQECEVLGVSDISLTGGEPLLQTEFLSDVIIRMKNSTCNGSVHRQPFRFHLETNGTLTGPMKQIDHLIDVIAMDIKLSSATGLGPLWEQHAEFLEACSVDKVFVKVVVAAESTQDEIVTASRLVSELSQNIPMILQPISGSNQPTGEMLMGFQNTALGFLSDVRVIPQCHKILGVR